MAYRDPEQKREADRRRQRSPEQKEARREREKGRWARLTDEQKAVRRVRARERYRALTEEERTERNRLRREGPDGEKREQRNRAARQRYHNLTEEKKAERREKLVAAQRERRRRQRTADQREPAVPKPMKTPKPKPAVITPTPPPEPIGFARQPKQTAAPERARSLPPIPIPKPFKTEEALYHQGRWWVAPQKRKLEAPDQTDATFYGYVTFARLPGTDRHRAANGDSRRYAFRAYDCDGQPLYNPRTGADLFDSKQEAAWACYLFVFADSRLTA